MVARKCQARAASANVFENGLGQPRQAESTGAGGGGVRSSSASSPGNATHDASNDNDDQQQQQRQQFQLKKSECRAHQG